MTNTGRRDPVRIGLVGYGVGGRYFHAPFIDAAEGIELAGVVTRDPARRAQVVLDWPGLPVFDSLAGLLASGVDAVTITTPPATRQELVLQAVAGRVAVVADKPFAPTAAAAQLLVDAARAAGVLLSVYHNRRWDADLRTLQTVLHRLGRLQRIESRLDLDQPSLLEGGPHGGLLRDLGSHLVDQMLWLLGPVTCVHATLDWVDTAQGRTDSAFDVTMTHANGVHSRVSATKANHVDERELRAYGVDGSYIARSTDVQARAVVSGVRPGDDPSSWGYEPESGWGRLLAGHGSERVPSERGAYQDYYTAFAAAVRGEGTPPVTPEEAVRTLTVLDAARRSAQENQVVAMGTQPTG